MQIIHSAVLLTLPYHVFKNSMLKMQHKTCKIELRKHAASHLVTYVHFFCLLPSFFYLRGRSCCGKFCTGSAWRNYYFLLLTMPQKHISEKASSSG